MSPPQRWTAPPRRNCSSSCCPTIDGCRGSLVLVTHNLGVVARYAQRIYIMYAGKIVEEGLCRDIFYRPEHPYTVACSTASPAWTSNRAPSDPYFGTPPNLIDLPMTCAFLPRCSERSERCSRTLAGVAARRRRRAPGAVLHAGTGSRGVTTPREALAVPRGASSPKRHLLLRRRLSSLPSLGYHPRTTSSSTSTP